MKINQVAELVGINKKNIRFYEDQGLVAPGRDSSNGYREYTLEDVKELNKIKLLRQLGVPIDDIRKLQSGELSFDKCMSERQRKLDEEEENLEQVRSMCSLLTDECDNFSELDASLYLDKMKDMERGGVKFMNVKSSDVIKRKTGALLSAIAVIVFSVVMIIVMIWANKVDPAPWALVVLMIAIFAAMIVGVSIALVQRFKEVNGGEEDAADKY